MAPGATWLDDRLAEREGMSLGAVRRRFALPKGRDTLCQS
jgi:hypothetical protein